MIWHPERPPPDGDPKLAEMMKDQPAPIEKIQMTDWLATAMNRSSGKLKDGERIVILECGHYAVTKSLNRCKCTACHEMILNGEDYDKFRNHP